jgi:hypothetical protein
MMLKLPVIDHFFHRKLSTLLLIKRTIKPHLVIYFYIKQQEDACGAIVHVYV